MFSTFEEYCRDKWGWKRAYAYQLIDAAGVVKSLPENVCHGIQNERQARALVGVAPEKRAQVIEIAAETAKADDRTMTAAELARISPVRM